MHPQSCFGEVHCGNSKVGQGADGITLENLSNRIAYVFNMEQKYLDNPNKGEKMLAIFQNVHRSLGQ